MLGCILCFFSESCELKILAGLLTCPASEYLPAVLQLQWQNEFQKLYQLGLTAAGTVKDLHLIPF